MIPKVSVIVAAYNIEDYIEKCIQSLKNQTLKEVEFIIVNDGSKDNTKSVILNLIKDDFRFSLINQENGGLSSARNTGIQHAKAEFIAFLDGDDYVEVNIYKDFYEKAIEENADLVISGFKKVWTNNQGERVKEKDFYFDKNKIKNGIFEGFCTKHDENFVVAWNKLFKKSILKENQICFENKAFFEDVGFLIEYLPHVQILSTINEPLINYIQREGSITNAKSFNPVIEESYVNVLSKLERYKVKNDLKIVLKNRLTIYVINYSLSREEFQMYQKFKGELIFRESYMLPFKHIVAMVLMKLNIYDLIFKKVV